VALGVVQARLLQNPAAVLEDLALALDLEIDRLLQEAEGVDVLDLRARAEGPRSGRPDGADPAGRMETLASTRSEPSCMLPSQIPR